MDISLIKKVESWVREYMSKYDPSHDWYHVDRVRNLALLLGRSLNQVPDLEVIELAALLHDVTDAKYADAHEGKISIKDLLVQMNYPQLKAEFVDDIVARVGYRKEMLYLQQDVAKDSLRETCQELHCVQDADKLDAIGAIGILRCAAFSGAKNIALLDPETDLVFQTSTPNLKNNSKTLSYNSLGSAISHFHDKLFNIKNTIRTELGKKLGAQRHTLMKNFIEQLCSEQTLFETQLSSQRPSV